ncbi:MAG: hypothetical protein ACLFV2_09015 [Desulfurivibrionaceae bacterium]
MDEVIKELNNLFKFKEKTDVGDIVIIAMESPKSIVYGLVTDIQRDNTRKEEWWHVTLQILSVPPQKVIWTLRLPQFTGQEIFTMGGEKRYIRAIDFSGEYNQPPPSEQDSEKGGKSGKSKLRVIK